MLSKNTCDEVHLIVKLPAIILKASKFTKKKLLHTHFSRILARFYKLLFIVLFLGIISWKGVLCFNGGWLFFRWGGGFIFNGGASILGKRVFEKNYEMMRVHAHPPSPTMGNPGMEF